MHRRVTTHDTPIVISNAKKKRKEHMAMEEEERRGDRGKGEEAVGKRRKVLDEGRRGDNRGGRMKRKRRKHTACIGWQ